MNWSGHGYDTAGTAYELTFNTSLASLHTYLGGKLQLLVLFSCAYAYLDCWDSWGFYLPVTDVEDTHHRVAFLDGGAILNLPMFYLEGIIAYVIKI